MLLILGIIVALILIAGAGIFVVMQQGGSNSSNVVNRTSDDSELKNAIDKYDEDIIDLEDVLTGFVDGSYNGQIFTNESKKVMDQYISSAKSFYNEIKDKNTTNEDILDDLNTLKERFGANIVAYNKAYEIYKNYYNALKNNDASLISQYLESSDNGEKTAAEAYTFYINEGENEEPDSAYRNTEYVQGIFTATIADAVNNKVTNLIIDIRDGLTE